MQHCSNKVNVTGRTLVMVDYHVHIGQWAEVYFPANWVFDELKANGVEEAWFSSTSSCRYCRESFDVIQKTLDTSDLPSALELYDFIKNEMKEALSYGKSIGLKTVPLYWIVPEFHFSKEVNLSVAKAMEEVPYQGFKLHPRGNHWDLSHKKTYELVDEVFSYANRHNLPILIHCGYDDFENPRFFEEFIAKYQNVMIQLAHCKPVEDTLYMLQTYSNTFCDTSFVPQGVQEQIEVAGFKSRMRYGSDFPITYWYEQLH